MLVHVNIAYATTTANTVIIIDFFVMAFPLREVVAYRLQLSNSSFYTGNRS